MTVETVSTKEGPFGLARARLEPGQCCDISQTMTWRIDYPKASVSKEVEAILVRSDSGPRFRGVLR